MFSTILCIKSKGGLGETASSGCIAVHIIPNPGYRIVELIRGRKQVASDRHLLLTKERCTSLHAAFMIKR